MKVKILDNLYSKMEDIGFSAGVCEQFRDMYCGSIQRVYAKWKDPKSGQEYYTIDLGVEIPVECCEITSK